MIKLSQQNALPKRIFSFLTCAILSVGAAHEVRAGGEVPSDIFSTPDTLTPPSFSGRNQPAKSMDPLFGPSGDPPGRDAIRAIPSMTGKQLTTLDQIIFSNRDQTVAMQEELNSLRRILDQRKNSKFPPVIQMGAPAIAPGGSNHSENMMDGPMMFGSGMMAASPGGRSGDPTDETALSPGFAGEPDEAIKARIDMLTQQISDTKDRLWPTVRSILTSNELQQLQAMRNGTLAISDEARTDLPEPVPPPPPIKSGHPAPAAVFNRPHPYTDPNQNHLIRPVIQTTKQVLYRALWGL